MNSAGARSGVAAAAFAAVLTLTACGSSAGDTSPTSPAAGSPSVKGGGLGQRGPAAAGTVAAIDGSTMQVQNPQSGQVAVTWTSATKFSHQVATTLAAVKTGDCVTAIAPSGTAESATSFTATSLSIIPSNKGSCGIVRGSGDRPSRKPTVFPSGFPSGQRPSGIPKLGAIAAGRVTSVSGSSLVIDARQFGSDGGPTSKTVTVSSSTKITTESSTTSHSLEVGQCVTAQGKADSTGTVAATSVRIAESTNGRCALTFGGRGPGA